MRSILALLVLTAGAIAPAAAYDFEPLKPVDTKTVNPELLSAFHGAYEIRDKSGKRRCRIDLKKEFGIGGYQITVAPGCDKVFPVMGDITAWRLQQNWTIDLVDGLRKTRVRFETPDNRYVPLGEGTDIAGMHELIKLPNNPRSKKK